MFETAKAATQSRHEKNEIAVACRVEMGQGLMSLEVDTHSLD